MSQENVEIVRVLFEAWKVGTPDLDAHLSRFDPKLVYHPRDDEPDTGPQGRDAYEQLLRGFVDSFSDLRIEVLEFIDAGDQVIAPTVLYGRMRNSLTEVNDEYVFVSELRDGLIVEVWEYRTKEQALEALGLSE